MDAALMEQLLNEEESSGLDFKREQYPFVGASDIEKGELLKDILAFANAWRREDAYILIGVDEVRGGRSAVIGVMGYLNDHELQQFVNSKTNRPVTFSYEAFQFEGAQIGVIRVEVQERPFYLMKDFGRLRANVVYMRRGSSTTEASMDEVAKMGAAFATAAAATALRPQLVLRARSEHSGRNIVLSLRNEGQGTARAPYLSFHVPQNYRISPYGVDGNYTPGFLGLPHGANSHAVPQFGGNDTQVIHPDTERDICVLIYNGHVNSNPTGEVVIKYETTAQGVERATDSVTINLG
jgi:hypothetical protein